MAKNEIFDVTIINEAYSFQIFINGKRFCTFAHRNNNPSDVETLEVEGGLFESENIFSNRWVSDVEVQTVTINDAVPRSQQ